MFLCDSITFITLLCLVYLLIFWRSKRKKTWILEIHFCWSISFPRNGFSITHSFPWRICRPVSWTSDSVSILGLINNLKLFKISTNKPHRIMWDVLGIIWKISPSSYIIYIYYYRYSAIGPVWAETRPQSGDWYGSGTLHPGQVLRGSLPLLSP